MNKIYVPAYETDVAVPPPFACICGKCKANNEPFSCHHNAFEKTYYKDPPDVRSEAGREILRLFRGTPYNRFYVPDCAHYAIQPTGQERAKRPNLDVISQFMGETAVLSNLDRTIYLSDNWLAEKYEHWQRDVGFSGQEIKRKRAEDWRSREASIAMVGSISVIPEEVVTAALIYSAPKVATERLRYNPDQPVVAPASWPKRYLRQLIKKSVEAGALTSQLEEIELAAA